MTMDICNILDWKLIFEKETYYSYRINGYKLTYINNNNFTIFIEKEKTHLCMISSNTMEEMMILLEQLRPCMQCKHPWVQHTLLCRNCEYFQYINTSFLMKKHEKCLLCMDIFQENDKTFYVECKHSHCKYLLHLECFYVSSEYEYKIKNMCECDEKVSCHYCFVSKFCHKCFICKQKNQIFIEDYDIVDDFI